MKLLSIIIPTKNRQKYCLSAVHQILSLNYNDIEIVIRDNSDEDTLYAQLLPSIEQGKIIYEHFDGTVSFVDNFSKSIELCSGKYVCMIGDDDGILPNILDVVSLAEKEGYDAIIPGYNSVFIWPSPTPIVKGAENGYLCLSYLKNRSSIANPTTALRKLLNNGGQNYMNYDLPRLYHGLVKRDVLDKIKKNTGNYFGGLTPDIYMSVALALTCNKVLRLYYPITISGICPQSGASNSATGKHTGNLEDAPHFKGHNNYVWDSKIAPFYSVETIWAETTLHALNDFKRTDLYNSFNHEAVNGMCYLKYPQYRSLIIDCIKRNNSFVAKVVFYSYVKHAMTFFKKVLKRVCRSREDVCKYYDVNDIQNAVFITKDFLQHLR